MARDNLFSSEKNASTDLIVVSHVLTDLTSSVAVKTTVSKLWKELADGGVMVLIEPGIPENYGKIMVVRDMLLGLNSEDDMDNSGSEPFFKKKKRKRKGGTGGGKEVEILDEGMWEDDGEWDPLDGNLNP